MVTFLVNLLLYSGLIVIGIKIGKLHSNIPAAKALEDARKQLEECKLLRQKYAMTIRNHQEAIEDLEMAKQYYYHIENN